MDREVIYLWAVAFAAAWAGFANETVTGHGVFTRRGQSHGPNAWVLDPSDVR